MCFQVLILIPSPQSPQLLFSFFYEVNNVYVSHTIMQVGFKHCMDCIPLELKVSYMVKPHLLMNYKFKDLVTLDF